ncbi:hypothetical protein C8R47DRAFT_1141712 [Mycena vitilis]|nr:hypothetical protein C8R47DRAFT_1141712 [Mycena vitilis]
MDPLKLSGLNATKDWDSFQPDRKGYLPPQPLALWPECDSIQAQIRQYTSTDFIRDNDAPFLALSVKSAFPLTRLTIRGETFAVPISPRDMAFLAAHLGDGRASRHTVSEAEFQILDDAARSFISGNCTMALRKIKASEGNGGVDERLSALDVLKAGSHTLMTGAQDITHFASIFVILPTFTETVDIRVHAKHQGIPIDLQLPNDLSQSASAICMYTGVSDARIDIGQGSEAICLTYHVSVWNDTEPFFVPRLEYLSGAMPPLRDAFCAWRHTVDTGGDAPGLILFRPIYGKMSLKVQRHKTSYFRKLFSINNCV